MQHLVREHKFQEPKVKTKLAIKRAGAQDPTWQKVEQCHIETSARPQDEPCRFCGRTLPTWKKLTVHLAKHMETMSLPILRLVARKQLDAETIISPVQELPPRTFAPVKSEAQQLDTSPVPDGSPGMAQQSGMMAFPHAQHAAYNYNPVSTFSSLYDSSITPQQPDVMSLGLHNTGLDGGFHAQASYQSLAVSSGSSYAAPAQYIPQQMVEPFPAYINQLDLQTGGSGNQMYDATGLSASNMGDQKQYGQHSSLSPYAQSPHQGQGGFFHQQQ